MTGGPPDGPFLTRRRMLIGGAGAVLVGGAAAAIWATPPAARNLLGHEEWFVPDAEEGEVGVGSVPSTAMGGEVGLFTAVPAGHGDGAGLPVVVVLHGASATVDEFGEFEDGFRHVDDRFLAAAARGAPVERDLGFRHGFPPPAALPRSPRPSPPSSSEAGVARGL